MNLQKTGAERRNPMPLVYFFWATLVVPLYLQRQYFNVVQAKCWCVNVGALLTLGLTLLYALWTGADRAPKPRAVAPELPELALLGLGLTATLSSLRSDSPLLSFLGADGAGVGALLWLNVALLSLLLRRCFRYEQRLWLPAMAVNLVVFGLCVPHSMGVDVLGLHERIVPEQYYWYLSTLGHVNMLAGYLCVIVPMLAVFYLLSETIQEQILYLVLWLSACLSMVLCGSDGLYLGLGAAAFFAIPCALESPKRLRRSLLLVACYGGALIVVRAADAFAARRAVINGLSGDLLNSPAGVLLLVLGGVGALLVWRLEKQLTPKRLRVGVWLLEGLMSAVVAGFVVHAVFTFDDEWGTKRGLIWRYSLELYQKLSPVDKLLGLGPERLRGPYEELTQLHGGRIVASHSEPIQLLLTTGAVGLLFWLVFWVWVILGGLHTRAWRGRESAFFLPLCAYLGQCMVNSSNPTNVGLLCVMLACYRIARTDGVDLRLMVPNKEKNGRV